MTLHKCIISETCRVLDVPIEVLLGRTRHPRVVRARWIAALLIHRMTLMTLPDIARAMGRQRHSTVHWQLRRFEAIRGERAGDLCPAHAGLTWDEIAGLVGQGVKGTP